VLHVETSGSKPEIGWLEGRRSIKQRCFEVFCFILSRFSPSCRVSFVRPVPIGLKTLCMGVNAGDLFCVSCVEMRRAALGCPRVDLRFPNSMPTWL
jgi:hypothetical protein